MGFFTEFFTRLYKDLIGDKLDGIKTFLDTKVGAPIGLLREQLLTITTHLDSKIGKPIKEAINIINITLTSLKDGIVAIPPTINNIVTQLMDLNIKLRNPIPSLTDIWNAIKTAVVPLQGIETVIKLFKLQDPEYRATVTETFGSSIKDGVKLVTDAALENLTPVFETFMSDQNIPEKDRQTIRAIAGSGEFGLNSVVGFMLGHFLSPVLSTSLAPAWETMAQQVWSLAPNRLVDPNMLTRLKYKGLITDAEFNKEMKFHGYNTDRQKAYTNDYLFLPTVGDTMRWAVREAFYDDYAAEYGLDNEYPTQLDAYGVKLGIETTELKYFWRSHWELPSLLMGFEMLHRDVIDANDLDKLFMATDILPWWRDKLKAISYKPYTRVDVRRMFKAGVINRDTVKRTYLDLGYDEDHAENLTIWTTTDAVSSERDLTRSHFERLYKDGQITREQATNNLLALGYDADESNLILVLVDVKLEDELEKDLIGLWYEQFKTHTITIEQLTSNLNGLTITEEKKERIIAKATRLQAGFITHPAKGDLISWFDADIITEDLFKIKMRQLGYTTVDIGYYIHALTEGGSE